MRFWQLLIGFVCGYVGNAQLIEGVVQDALSGEPLIGVTITYGHGKGTVTDHLGRFRAYPDHWPALLTFHMIGYDTVRLGIPPPQGSDVRHITVHLRPSPLQLQQVVIVESQRPTTTRDAIRSLALLPSRMTDALAISRLDHGLEYVPGTQLFKGQLNIRGGSGFTYGAGSRTILIWRGMPFLTADVGDIRWNYFPTLHISQVEILKGPASALYGAGALEGVIQLGEKTANTRPRIDLEWQQGFYAVDSTIARSDWTFQNFWQSPRDSTIYLPYHSLIQAGYRQRIGRLQLFGSALWEADNGYRHYDENIRQVYHVRSRLTIGRKGWIEVGGGWMNDTGYNFLFATDLQRPYLSGIIGSNPYRTRLWHFDATYTMIQPQGKIFAGHRTTTIYRGGTPEIVSNGTVHHFTCQVYRQWHNWHFAGGGALTRYVVASPHMYGKHVAHQAAFFGQFEWQQAPWRWVIGFRGERYRIDTDTPWLYPALRLGINRTLGRGGAAYASIGQGVRAPSIAERYIRSTTGGIRILPNPDLAPEQGWSIEAGYRQALQRGAWQVLYEGGIYRMEFHRMVEFQFGFWFPDTFNPSEAINYLGFSARNITHAIIWGTEHKINWRYAMGILTYEGWVTAMLTYPINPALRLVDSPDFRLRYRTPRMGKAFHHIRFQRWGIFTALQYYGPLTGVDPLFTSTITGLKEYLQQQPSSWIWDLGVSYALSQHWHGQVVLKNALNTFYMPVPGNVGPPRRWSFVIRYRR